MISTLRSVYRTEEEELSPIYHLYIIYLFIRHQQVLAPTFTVVEHYFQAQCEAGQVQINNVPLTTRAIAGTLFGLLMFQLLGDEVTARQWEELPEVLTSLLFDGLLHKKEP